MSTSEIKIKPCKWADIQDYVCSYLKEHDIVVDSFWEDHVLGSNYYIMTSGDFVAGYFAIHNGTTITLFNVFEHYANGAQELFGRVKKYENVTNALVPTGDEFFLSHCIDNFARLEKQAYFAIYTDKEIPKENKINLRFRLADVNADKQTLAISGDFLNDEIESIKKGNDLLKIYIVEKENDVVGFGVVQYGRICKETASIGMYVVPEYRMGGIGSNILENLKKIVNEKGYRAFSGCWYYNHNSKKTMERAGAYSRTRLVRFFF